MRKFPKALCMILAATTCATAVVGCGGNSGGSSDGNGTKIYIMNFDGGVGRQWLDNAAARFAEKVKDVSYEENKMGVEFEIDESQATGTATMNTSGYNMYFDVYANVNSLSQAKFLMDITDIVTEEFDTRDGQSISIEDKIDEGYRSTLQGVDGKYYALPYFALYPGLTYDVELFKAYDMYFAAPDETNAENYTATVERNGKTSTIGSAKFAITSGGEEVKLSCGNDGKYGTYDDGLPTSMVEFFILCHRLAYNDIEPLAFAGKQTSYTTYLYDALWASLSGGYEAAKTRYTFSGTAEFVLANENDEDNYYTESVWEGFDDVVKIKKPKTEKIAITRGETGYRASDNVARYYATAAMKIFEEMGWFAAKSYVGTDSHTDGMESFIFAGKNGKPKQGMFIEGDYWYNEAADNNKVSLYKKLYPNAGDRQIAWMPLPTHPYEAVTGEDNAREFVMVNTSSCTAFINANIKDNEGLTKACKEFLQFLYSDSELSQFTGLTGVAKAGMNYSVLPEHTDMLSFYHKEILKVRENENTKILNATQDPLSNDRAIYPTINGLKYGNYVKLMRDKPEISVEEIFKQTRTGSTGWGVENL